MFLPVYLKSWESYWANQSIGFEPLVYDNGGLLFSLIPTLPRTFHGSLVCVCRGDGIT